MQNQKNNSNSAKNLPSSFYLKQISKIIDNSELISTSNHDGFKISKSLNIKFREKSTINKERFNQELVQLSLLSKETDLNGQTFLKRLVKYGDFPLSVFIMAALSFTRILLRSDINKIEKNMSIKLFSTCLNISQKLLMDDDWILEDFAALTGLRSKSITSLEQFLLNEVFEFSLRHNSSDFTKFKKWLVNLDLELIKIKDLKTNNNLKRATKIVARSKISLKDEKHISYSSLKKNVKFKGGKRNFVVRTIQYL